MTTINPKWKNPHEISEQTTEQRVKVLVFFNFNERKVEGI